MGLLRLRPGLQKFFGNRNLLERSDDKVPAEVVKLASTFFEWHHIFYDCVKCLHLCECPALQKQASTNTQTLWFMYRQKKKRESTAKHLLRSFHKCRDLDKKIQHKECLVGKTTKTWAEISQFGQK